MRRRGEDWRGFRTFLEAAAANPKLTQKTLRGLLSASYHAFQAEYVDGDAPEDTPVDDAPEDAVDGVAANPPRKKRRVDDPEPVSPPPAPFAWAPEPPQPIVVAL